MLPLFAFAFELILFSSSVRAQDSVSSTLFLSYRCWRLTQSCPKISWGPCDPSVSSDASLSCGFFEIPLDYNDASAGTGRLAVSKLNATASPSLGTLYTLQGASAPAPRDS